MVKLLRKLLIAELFVLLACNLYSAEKLHSHSNNNPNKNFTTSNFSKEYDLLYASSIGDVETVKLLLKSKVNPNVVASPKEYEYFARNTFKRERFESEEAYNEFCRNWRSTPLIIAVARNHLECVKLLISAGADFTTEDTRGETAFLCAVKIGNPEMLKYLYLHGGQINLPSKKYNQTPLYVAAANKQSNVVQWLLSHKADATICDLDGISPAFLAVQNNDIETLNILVSYKTDIDIPTVAHITPLMDAVFEGYFDIVKLLVEAGADINYSGIYGFTPIIAAGRNGEQEIFEYMLNKNPDVKIADESGQTVLMQACKFDEISYLKTIVKKGGNINQTDNDENTALFYAIQNNQAEMVKFMITLGADVNHVNIIGFTPLMTAVNRNDTQITDILLFYGADINFKNSMGLDALKIAEEQDLKDLQKLIKAYRERQN